MAEFHGRYKVVKVGEVLTFASGFRKREVLVQEVNERFAATLPLYLLKDSCEWADGLRNGDMVDANISVRSREYNGKHFVELVAFRLHRASNSQANYKQSASEIEIEKESSSPYGHTTTRDDECDF